MSASRCGLALSALGMVVAGGGAPTFASAAEGAEAHKRIAGLLQRWDVIAAEEALAAEEGKGELGVLMRILKAELRFYQGDYDGALALIDSLDDEIDPGDRQWRQLVAEVTAAKEETDNHVEVRSEDGRFIIRHAPGQDAVLVPLMLEALPKMRERLGDKFGLRPAHPVVVEVYPTAASLGHVTGLGAEAIENSGTIAICKFNRLMITSPAALVRGYGWLDTLAHEYVHLLVNKLAGPVVPIWLHEGIAKYHESFWASDARPALHPAQESIVAVALRDDQLITFDEMSPSMALLPTPKHTMLAFAEVQTVIEYLLSKHGDDSVRRVLDLLRTGEAKDDRQAIARVTGLSFAAFERNWRGWLKRQRLQIRKDAGVHDMKFKKSDRPDDLEELDSVDRSIRDHLKLGDLLRGRDRSKAGLREYERAQAISGPRVNPLIRTKMASAHLALDNPEAAIAAVAPVPDLHEGYALAYILLGRAHLALEHWEDAKVWLGRALGYNPYDQAVHMGLQQACVATADDTCVQRAVAAMQALQQSAPGGKVAEEPEHE